MVLATLGLNPLVVMYASIGARSFLWLAFVIAALGALFAWYVTADIRFVMIAGLAFAVAALTGYGSLLFFLLSLVMVAAILARLGADGTEIAVGYGTAYYDEDHEYYQAVEHAIVWAIADKLKTEGFNSPSLYFDLQGEVLCEGARPDPSLPWWLS